VHHNRQEFIGVDVGGQRLGIARGNNLARIAEPLKTVPYADAISQLTDIIKVYAAGGVVVGLPRNLNGQETAQTQSVRQWVKLAQHSIKLPFFWQDEALSSQQAEKLKSKIKSPGVDAEAAAIILQDFLDTAEDDRVEA
jgi:putative Holliday junction resolvase